MFYNRRRPDAYACIRGGREAPSITGRAEFYQNRGNVLVVIRLSGLPQTNTGFFALHIHEGSDCSGEGFPNTLSHYNPAGVPHPMHAGDLPPLLRCGTGAYLAVKTDRFCVKDIIGRTLVVHSSADDFVSQPAGNAGMKIACGTIRKA